MTLNEYTVRRINHVIEESGIGVSDEVEFAADTYQNIKMGKGFGSQEMYMYAIQHLFSDDIYERSLAHIVYVCTRSEQDAFINGAYTYVKSNWGPMPVDELMKKTEAYAWLQNLYKAVNVLKKSKTEIKPYIHPYTEIDGTFNYGKFMRIALKGVHEFEWKMARLVKGMKKRFLLEFNVHPQMPSRDVAKTWLWQLR